MFNARCKAVRSFDSPRFLVCATDIAAPVSRSQTLAAPWPATLSPINDHQEALRAVEAPLTQAPEKGRQDPLIFRARFDKA